MQSASVVPPQTRCYHCHYDLQGLEPSSNCPECGQAISLTLTFGLSSADRAWVRRQAKTVALLLALPVLQMGDVRSFGFYGALFEWTNAAITWALVVVLVWACWRLSTPEPGRDPGDAQSALARGLRLCALAYAGVLVMLPFWRTFQEFAFLIGYAGVAAMMLTTWLALRMLWALSRRSGRESLTAHAKVATWALPISSGLKFGLVPVLLRTPILPDVVMFAVYLAAWWGTLLAAVATVALIGRIHEVLRLVADGVWDSADNA
jgi:hypothetical protein